MTDHTKTLYGVPNPLGPTGGVISDVVKISDQLAKNRPTGQISPNWLTARLAHQLADQLAEKSLTWWMASSG